MTTIGDRIREARKSLKLNQADFGEMIKTAARPDGYSYQTISKYETGADTPDIETLKLISDVTKKPVSWFLGEEQTALQISTVEDVLKALEQLETAFQSEFEIDGNKDQRITLSFQIPRSYKKVLEDIITMRELRQDRRLPDNAYDIWYKSIMEEQKKISVEDMHEVSYDDSRIARKAGESK